MTGAMFPNARDMTIAAKAELGPCSTRMRYQRPRYAAPANVDVAEAGSYLPLYQLRAMGVRTPEPEKEENFSTREAAVPTLPGIAMPKLPMPVSRHRGGPATHPRGNRRPGHTLNPGSHTSRSTKGLANVTTKSELAGIWKPMPPPAPPGLAPLSKRTKVKPIGRKLRAKPLQVEGVGDGRNKMTAAEILRVAMAVIRCGEHTQQLWAEVAAEVGNGRSEGECRECWRRILIAQCEYELVVATRDKDLPGLRKALGRAASLQHETRAVKKAELKQAELESLVREYDDGIEGGIDHILPWDVAQLVKQLRVALYKTATGQSLVTMLRRWDPDGSGEITYDEFVIGLRQQAKIPSSALRDEQIRLLYDHVDTDGSGTIEPEELISFLKRGADQRLRGASKLPDEEEEKRKKLLGQHHEAGVLEHQMLKRDRGSGPARRQGNRKKEQEHEDLVKEGKDDHSGPDLKQLLNTLFDGHDSNRYLQLLMHNGFEEVDDVKLAGAQYFENLGMPIHAVELLLSAAQDAEQHVPEVVDEALVSEARGLVSEWFGFMDKDGSGSITMHEARDLLNALGPREGARLSWGELLAELDSNNDGVITVEEVEDVFLSSAPTDNEAFEIVVLKPLRDLRGLGWEVVGALTPPSSLCVLLSCSPLFLAPPPHSPCRSPWPPCSNPSPFTGVRSSQLYVLARFFLCLPSAAQL